MVDPGHNGGNGRHTKEINRLVDAGGFKKACNTTGTAGAGLTEAAYNWATSQRLRDALTEGGAKVVMTRTDNDGWGPCIDARGLAAKQSNATMLVSIHADGAATSGHGFHVIVPGLVPGYTDASAASSLALGTAVRDALVAAGFTPSTYTAKQGLAVRKDLGTLNRAGVPAIIIESGNMRNASDLEQLKSEEWQQQFADTVAQAALAFARTPR